MTPFCDTHGPMQYRPMCAWWTCAGWDGEGCPTTVWRETIVTGAQSGPSDRRPGEFERAGSWHLAGAR